MVWVVLVAMTGLAIGIALWPLGFGRARRSDSPSEVAFYRAQLSEIDRDVERGQLPLDEAGAARAETARRLLAAKAEGEASARHGAPARHSLAAIVAAVVIPAVAIGVYNRFGSPGMPDAPLASRQIGPSEEDSIDAAVARVEADISASPDNLKAWSVLAPVYLRLGRYDDAVNAYKQVLRLKGEDGELRADLGEAQVAAAGGIVTSEARATIDKALADNPDLPMARFYLGLAAEQEGDKTKAIAIYQSLIDATSDHPHWQDVVKGRIAALNGETPAAPANAAAAANPGGSAGGQQEMICGMVSRLADRLAASGGNAEDWTRLVRSYAVLNEPDKAKAALASARTALAGDANAMASLDALAKEIDSGQMAPAASAGAKPDAAAAAPSPDGSAGGQQEMIRGMVSRLADRLATSGGNAEDWTRLVRSYAVLNEPDKAKEALVSARKALAGDANATASLDALAKDINPGNP